MQPIAAAMDESQIARLARYYSDRAAAAPPGADEAERDTLQLGRRIATEGIADRQIAACSTCHGLERGPENALFPALSGQYPAYAVLQLTLWKEAKRGGSSYSEIMQTIARNLSPQEIQAVAAYYASIASQRTDPAAESKAELQ
jgi:cytochrome c553